MLETFARFCFPLRDLACFKATDSKVLDVVLRLKDIECFESLELSVGLIFRTFSTLTFICEKMVNYFQVLAQKVNQLYISTVFDGFIFSHCIKEIRRPFAFAPRLRFSLCSIFPNS